MTTLDDRMATHRFVFLNVLAGHCGQLLTPELIDTIVAELQYETRDGPSSWAFFGQIDDQQQA